MKLTSKPNALKDLLAAPAKLSAEVMRSIRLEASSVKLCSDKAIEIMGQTFRPDQDTAYVEFFLSHAFPVTTCDGTGIHPQVVANSYRTLLNKVFDFEHQIASYDKSIAQDRALGTIVGVEFPPTPDGGWKVQADKNLAPGIRAVAVVHKQLQGVPEILRQHFSGRTDWAVSMEQDFYVANSGFLMKARDGSVEKQLLQWSETTPDDLIQMGYFYCSAQDAPLKLLNCFDPEKAQITSKYLGLETTILFGGLDGTIRYKGTGLVWRGKEKEAVVGQMLASAGGPTEPQNQNGIVEIIKRTAGVWES